MTGGPSAWRRAAAVLALAVVLPALLPGQADAQETQNVQSGWSLIPPGVSVGQSFRLLFVTSTRRNAVSGNIADYNTFVQGRAAASTAISGVSGLSAKFRALISTSTVDARANTDTESTDTDAIIYWLGGKKVADDYDDFYDGTWDNREGEGKTESGGSYTTDREIWTGSNDNGTKSNVNNVNPRYAASFEVKTGDIIGASKSPISHYQRENTNLRPLYALSPVFTVVADTTAPTVTSGSTGYYGNAGLTTALTGPQKSGASIYTKVTFPENMKHTKSNAAAARPELFHRIGTTDTQYDILDNGDTLASGDCKPNHASNTNVYVCRYTVGSSDTGAFAVKVGTNSVDKANNALASAYTHAATLTLDTTDPNIAFPSGVTPKAGTAATITLTDATAKVAKYGIVEVAGTATDATGCDDPSAGGDNFTTTAVSPLASSKNVSYTPVTAGKKVCVYAEDAAGNSKSKLWTTAIAAASTTTVTPVPPNAIWSATLTVSQGSGHTALSITSYGCDSRVSVATQNIKRCSASTVLNDNNFDYAGTTYTIQSVYHHQSNLYFRVNGLTPAQAKTALGALTLNVGGTAFAISAGTASTAHAALSWPKGSLSWSTGDTVSLSLTPPVDNTRPVKPTTFTAAPGNQRVVLSWTIPTDATITKWQYRQKTTGSYGSWQNIASSDKDTVTHTVTGLMNGTQYTFQVRAHDAGGAGATSDAASATPAATVPDGVTYTADPSGWFKKNDTVGFRITVTVPQSAVNLQPLVALILRTGAAGCTGSLATWGSSSISPNVATAGQHTFDINVGLTSNLVGTGSDKFCASVVDSNLDWEKKFPLAGFKVDHTKPTVEFPAATTVPTEGQSYTLSLGDAHSKLKKYGAIAVDGSTGAAADCDTAAEVGSTNLTTEATAQTSKSFVWTVPASSAGKKVCVYAEDAAGNIHSALGGTAIVSPPPAPTVSSVELTSSVADGQNGHYKIGDTVAATVTFSAAVTVTGTPSLELQVGSNARPAAYAGGGGSLLTFNYRVQEGDADSDGIAIGANKLSGGTIKETTGVTDANRNFSAVTANSSHKVDGVRPTITGVAVTAGTLPSGATAYPANHGIFAVVTFSEDVTITGAPTIALKVGANSRTATYTVAGATATVKNFRYPTIANEEDLDGVSAEAGSLTVPNNASIKDAAGNTATVTHNAVDADADVKVDSKPPVAPTGFGASPGNTEAVLTWTDPGDESIAKWQFQQKTGNGSYGSWTNIAGSDKDTITHTVTGLMNGTSYGFKVRAVDIGANNGAESAEATATPAMADTTAPTVSTVALTSSVPSNQNGHYKIGDKITATVTFNEAVDVTGKPELELQIGSNARPAVYAAGSGGTALTFDYTVVEGDADTDGIAIGQNKLTLSGGTIEDGADNAANRNHSAVAANAAHKVDGVRPTVTGVRFSALPAAAMREARRAGDPLQAFVQFSENVNVTGTPTLTLRVGTNDRTASYTSGGSSGDSKRFNYNVQANEEDLDGASVDANSLTVPNNASIKDDAGNDATVTHDAVDAQSNAKVDAKPPVAPTGFGASPGNAEAVLTWTDPGDESIAKWQFQQKEGNGNYGAWTNIAGSDKDTITHTVTGLMNGTSYGFKVRAVDIGANDGAASAEATAMPTMVDTTAPTVTAASTGYFSDAALATALTGPQKSGASIYTKVTFSENMKHTKSNAAAARPELFHRIGTTDTQYDILDNGDTLASGDCKPNHASNTNVYVCLYTVGSSDTGAFTVKAGTNSVDKADNALASAYTHAATLTLDTTAPKITGIAVTSTPKRGGTYTAGETIEFTVTFDEKVNVVESFAPSGPILQYLLGSGEANARYKRGSGTTEVVFGTDLVLGRLSTLVDTDGISIVANPPILAVAGASIRDTANNDADLSYAGLAAQSGHKVDNKPPLAPTGLTATPGDRRVTLGWSAPTPADASIASWQYQQRVGTGAWGAWTDVPGSRRTTTYMVRLLGDLAYGFRVRAQDAANDGAASAEATATPTGGSLDRLTPPRARTVEAGGPLVPKGSGGGDLVAAGAKFRLLFVTSTTRDATSANIADYNSFVQARAGAASTANAAIKSFSSQFRALISTATAHARDNTATTGAGEPIYWLGGAKVADDYNDFYDGSWDSGPGKTELGQPYASSVWTGSKANGTTDAAYPAGASRVRLGSASQGQPTIALGDFPISGHALAWETTHGLLALSPVLTVVDRARPAEPAGLSGSRGVREVTLSWTAPAPADGSIVRYEYRQKSGTGAYGAWTAIAGSGAATTSHTVGNLAKGIYTFQVRAVDSLGAGAASDAVELSPSDEPTGLAAVGDIDSVTLTWDDPEDPTITGYQFKRDSGDWTDIRGSGAGTVSHTVRKLTVAEHAFRVRAVYAVGESEPSAVVRATPSYQDSGAPALATELKAVAGNGRATLSWDNLRLPLVRDPGYVKVAGWEVRYAAGGAWGAWRAVELPGGMAAHFRAARVGVTVTGLANGTAHHFQVRAVSESEPPVAGPGSDAATATPSGSIPAVAVTPGTDRLEVSWAGAAEPRALTYGVEVRSGSYLNKLAVFGGSGVILKHLTPGTVYAVRVTWSGGFGGDGALIGEVRATTLGAAAAPGRVTGMRVHNGVGNSGLEAVWEPVLGADGYKVQWKRVNEAWGAARVTAVAGEATSSHLIGGLVPGQEYTVRVLATREGAPDGAASAEASAWVRGAWTTSADGELTVHWALEPNPNVWGYEVDYRTALAENHRSYYHNVVAVRGDSWTLKYLMPGQEYVVRVGYLFDIAGHEQFFAEVKGTPSGAAELMPQMSAASVRGDVMRIGYDASLDGDSTPPAGSYSVRAGQAQRAVSGVAVAGQTVTLRLARPVGAGAAVTVDYHPPSGDGAIRSAAGHAAPGFSGQSVENGTPAALSVADAQAAEGGSLAFAVTLDRAVSGAVTVAWATADGTATAGADYEAASGTLTFAPGETEKTVSVALLEDTADDDAETLTLTLSNPTGATLADAEATGTVTDTAPALPPLTASIAEAPPEHGGKGKAFAVRIAFSAPLAEGAGKALRKHALSVDGGAVRQVRRVDGRLDLWSVRIRPARHGAVTLRLASPADCASAGAICTADGRALTNAPTVTVTGPPALSVADARAKEGADESIAFAVTLSRAASDEVTVRYATRNGTAKAGEDYRRARGKLTFAVGETEKTIAVALLDDAKDEGEETFTLVLNKASGAVIADGEAVGTIENSDPLQQAWLARFGRTVASQAVDAVTARLEGLAPGAHATLAGQHLDLSRADDAEALAEAMTGLARAFGAPAAPAPEGGEDPFAHGSDGTGVASSGARSMSGRELLLGSSFHLATGDESGGPGFAAWGRAAHGSFEGEAGDVTLDGDVTTGFLGADVSSGRWLAGAAIAHSQGEGTFALTSGMDSTRDRGTVESTLTSVLPYARVDLSERVSAWGLAGWGTGTLTLTETGETGTKRYRADLSMTMGALGGRGTLVPAPEGGGFALALGSDAFWVRTESESVPGMTGAKADATRLRLTLDASRPFALTGGGTLTPSLEVGLRHDGGDAETGAGVELGAGLGFSDPGSGVSAELRTRWLAAHESESYEEWGVSGSVRIDPGARGRGLSLSLAPTVGNASSGTGALWSAADARGLAPGTEFEAGRRFEARLGYGFATFGGGFTGTPNIGFGLSDTGRDYRLGWRLTSAVPGDPGFEVNLDATRKETANGNEPPEHGVMLRGAIRW